MGNGRNSIVIASWRWCFIENMVIGVGCDCIVTCIGHVDDLFPCVGDDPSSIVVIALIWQWDIDVLGIIVSLNCAT